MCSSHLDTILDLCRNLQKNERRLLPLCAAENAISPFGRIPLDSFIQEKYIMGSVRKLDAVHNFMEAEQLFGFYELLNEQCFTLFNSRYADARTLSGVNAVMLVLMSLFHAGDTLLISSEDSGGHSSMPLICKRLGINTIQAPFDYETMDFDYEQIKKLRRERTVNGILICPSDLLIQPHLERLQPTENFVIIYDATQTLGLIAGKENPNPLNYFDDTVPCILMGATHKTLPGPTSGLVLTNTQQIADQLDTRINPDYLRNVQFHQILSLMLVLAEMETYGADYSARIIENANTLGGLLDNWGFDVIRLRDKRFSDTHQIFISMSSDKIPQFLKRCFDHGIALNARYKKLYRSSGIRLGTQAISRYGWEATELKILAEVLYMLTLETYDKEEVENRLVQLRCKKQFKYTFSSEEYEMFYSSLHDR